MIVEFILSENNMKRVCSDFYIEKIDKVLKVGKIIGESNYR